MSTKTFVAVLVLGSVTAALAQQPAFKRTLLQTVDLSIAGQATIVSAYIVEKGKPLATVVK